MGVALTTDIWTSTATEGYITLTAHSLESWNYVNCVLATRDMKNGHTADNISTEIVSVLADFGIKKEQVVRLVTDNASNIVKLCRKTVYNTFSMSWSYTATSGISTKTVGQRQQIKKKAKLSHKYIETHAPTDQTNDL